MRKKTIKYTIVDLGGTRYVVLRLADLDTLNLAISHLHTLLGNIRLASITVGPSEADQPDSASNQ